MENWEGTLLQRVERLGGRPRLPGGSAVSRGKAPGAPVGRTREPLPSSPALKVLCTHMTVMGTQLCVRAAWDVRGVSGQLETVVRGLLRGDPFSCLLSGMCVRLTLDRAPV